MAGAAGTGRQACAFARYAAYIFDFDGTLLDSEDLNLRTVHATLAAFGIDVPAEHINAEPFVSVARLRDRFAIPASRVPDEAFVAAARAYWLAHADEANPIPATVRALRRAARHAPVAVASANDGQVVRAGLEIAGITATVTVIVAREDVHRLKPDPEAYLTAACLLHVTPSRCLAYENTTTGITAARAAGMDVIDTRGLGRCEPEPA